MDTLHFAAAELKKYISAITGTSEAEISLSINEKMFSGRFQKYDPYFDDGYRIDVKGGKGEIVGSNARACLLGVYAFLRGIGCLFLRPGKDGEKIPSISLEKCDYALDFTARYRHRGITIEGAVSEENVLDMIAYAPKAGFNSYFMQFRNSYEFFERWYLHKNNSLLPAEKFDAAAIQGRVEEAIKTRGLIYHAVGHGWTAEALGCSVNGWERKENAEDNPLIALVGGKRGYFKGVPSNTNLCYSQPKAIELFTDCVTEYAAAHPEIDVLHVWLADDCKNFCECEQCRDKLPSDFYVEILNEIDRKLTARNIGVKIAFLAYCELLWPPKKNRIKNEERFILVFAPITRSYSEKFSEAIEKSEHYDVEPYFLNESDFPRELSRNLAFLRGWKERFKGDSFIFDYPLMWEVNKDISTISLSETIRDDVLSFEKAGLNGEISCQLQRVFFPHGLNQSLMGRLLLGEPIQEDYTREFLRASFGSEKGDKALLVMKLIRENIPAEYFRYEIPAVCFALAEKAETVRFAVLGLERELFGKEKTDDDENERLLRIWTRFTALVLEAFCKKMHGENCVTETEKCLEYLRKNELAVQPYLDVCYMNTTLSEILSFRWDKEIDEGMDESRKGSVGKQVGESFVCDFQPVKLRYRNILPASLKIYRKNSFGAVAQTYEEGKDFLLDLTEGKVIRTKNSTLPDFSENVLYGVSHFNHNDFEKWGNGDFMIYADYKYDSEQISDAEYAKEISLKNGCFGSLKKRLLCFQGKKIKISVFGDSISFGCEATAEGNAYFYRFANAIERKYKCEVEVYNRSVIGNTTDDALARFDSAFETDDSQFVLTAFGMNDQNKFGSTSAVFLDRFEKNLKMIADRLSERNKFPIFITPCIPNEKWVYCSGRIGEYADVILKVAAEYGLPCADVYALWKKQLETGKKEEDLLNNDINHPTDYGHFLYYLQLKQLI